MSRTAFRQYIVDEFSSLPRPQGGSQRPPPSGVQGPPPPVSAPDATNELRLPDFSYASQIVPGKIVLPEQLVSGLLHRGCKLMLSGGSKSFKSWVLMHLGLAVSNGQPWWGMDCKRGRVLYLNFELIAGFFEERLLSICRAMNISPPQNFLYWNLRGHCYDLVILAKVITARLADFGPFDLIIVDPIYKALGDLDENAASDMTKLMNLIESIAVQTGAAVAFGSHFSKGNQASKEAKDRPSGSGVLIRDPDAILTMTRHKEEHCYVVNAELRYLAPLPEFVVRWNFPIMQADESLDPRQLFVPGQQDDGDQLQSGGPASYSENDVLDALPIQGAQDTLWRKMINMRFGKSGPAFYALKAALIAKGLVQKRGNQYFRTNLKFDKQ